MTAAKHRLFLQLLCSLCASQEEGEAYTRELTWRVVRWETSAGDFESNHHPPEQL